VKKISILEKKIKKRILIQMNRRERERHWRRQYILSVAEKLFAKNGFYRTGITEIAKASEFGIGTVYQFFKNKEEIYATLVGRRFDNLFELIKEATSKAGTPTEMIKALIKTKLYFFQKNYDFLKIFISEHGEVFVHVREDWRRELRKKYHAYIDFVAKIVEEGIKKGEFKDLPPKEAATLIIGSCNALIYKWTTDETENSLTKKLPQVLEVIFYGLKRR